MRRLMALMLAFAMLLSVTPVAVFAAEGTKVIKTNVTWEDGDVITGVTIGGNVTITVKGTVTVAGTIRLAPDAICNVTFNGENNAKLIRGAGFTGQMFYAEGVSGRFQELTFNNITLDGGAVWTGKVDKILNRGTTNSGVKATGSVLYLVCANAVLNDSVLQNHDDSTGEKANAVFLRYYSTIDFNNSVVKNNNSISGYYSGGVITVRQGGTVKTNNAEVYGNSGVQGGFFGTSSTGSYGGIVEVYDSKFHHNYADNGAVFDMQCNSKIGYLLIDGCEFYNNGSNQGLIYEHAYSRPAIIKDSYFYNNECAVWDCHTPPVLDISGKIVIEEDPNYEGFLFQTPLALSGPLAEGSSIPMSEASVTKLGGTILQGANGYTVTEADLAKFDLPEGYQVYAVDVNGDGVKDVVAGTEEPTAITLTLKDSLDADASANGTVYDKFACLPICPFAHEGYVFDRWEDAEGNAVAKQKFTETATLTATWKLETPVVAVNRIDNATLKATVNNKYDGFTYTYQWYKNNIAIAGATGDICAVTGVKEATYKCAVTVSDDDIERADQTGSASCTASAPAYIKIGDAGFDTLQDAMDAAAEANTKDIVIDLFNNATLDIAAWQTLAIGGEDTETITINGNDHTLVFNKLNSDWNHVTTKNNNAKLILNNMILADSGYNNGPWNRYDINFACDVELNDVVSNKALAFKADATLNNVTVNESGDNYAIWIQANGQTVVADGLTVNAANGRGIKIDEEYVTAAKVNLTVTDAEFTTAKKAAILVKTAGGADITYSNVDISKVKADSINVVWVDEDAKEYFTKVTVNGGRPVIESDNGPIPDLTVVNELFKRLKEAGYITDAQAVDIINYIYPMLLSGEKLTDQDLVDIAKHVYDVVLKDSNLTVEDAIAIVNIVYGTLKKYNVVTDEEIGQGIVDLYQKAYTYIVENYNEIYNNAWNLAEANGFVDMANGYIDQVVAVINSIDYSALADKTHLIPTLNALKAEVLGDVEALRALINNPDHPTAGEITALMNELNNDLTALQNVAAQADLDAVAQLITLHKQIMKQYDIAYNQACAYICEQLGQAYDMLVAEIVRIAAEQNAAAAEKLAQYLGQNPADLIDTILKYGADAQAFINYWSYYAEMLLGPAWNEYGEDITAFVQENIAKLMASLKAEAEALGNEAADALMAYIADLKIAENVTAIAEQLKNGSLELGQDTLAELEGIVNSLNGQLIDNANEVILALEALAECEDAAAAKAIIDAAIAEIRKTEADRMAALDAIYADIMAAKATVDEATAAVLELQDAALVLANLLENPLSFNFDNTMNAVTTLLDELNDAVITVQAAVNEIVTLTNDVTATAQKIYNEALASKDQIHAALAQINSTLQNAGSDAQILAGNAYTAAEAYVLGTLGKVEADARDLLALCNTELQNAVNSVIATVNTYLFNATHGDYEIDRFSKYVALGEKEAYADELATLLGMADRYVKMSLTEDYLSEVAGADLVTVKFDNGEFLTFAYNQVMGMAAELINGNASLINLMKNPYYGATVKEYVTAYVDLNAKAEELDWNAYLDARAQGVLRETLANVKTLMLEDGVPEVYAFDIGAILTEMLNEGNMEDPTVVINLVLDIPVADLALAAIENVLYGYVRFAYEFQAVVNEIHAVSPDAEVVISGIENPAVGMVLKIAGTQVNVGEYAEYVQYVVDALNLHLYAYALATDNTTYVESNTATDIRNALNVTYKGLMGDVNNDGAVTLVDAILVLDYSNGVIGAEGLTLGMADVDGDGEVKLVDAILILDFSNGVLEYFPAELQ